MKRLRSSILVATLIGSCLTFETATAAPFALGPASDRAVEEIQYVPGLTRRSVDNDAPVNGYGARGYGDGGYRNGYIGPRNAQRQFQRRGGDQRGYRDGYIGPRNVQRQFERRGDGQRGYREGYTGPRNVQRQFD
jgi:hypothetical protein